MKKVFILACVVLFFGGCGYSNWNVFGEPSSQGGTQTTTPTMPSVQEPTRPEDIIQDGQTIGGETMANTTEIEMDIPKDRENMFHINTVVSAWGRPDNIRIGNDDQKHYIWEVCRDGRCCSRDIITDDEGYVMKYALKEAVARCI